MRKIYRACFPLLLLVSLVMTAEGQIRIATYNTLDKPIGTTEENQLDTILAAIAATDRNGIAKRIDIVSLQEQEVVNNGVSTTENVAARLNAIHGVTSYESAVSGNGSDRIGIVYDTSTVTLTQQVQIPTEPRTILRSRFRPVGYDSPSADFYVHGMHLKAGTSSSDVSRRVASIGTLKDFNEPLADILIANDISANFLYMGDMNIYRPTETTFISLTADGSAQGIDPIQLPRWDSSAFAEHLTQSTRTSSIGDGGAGGGLDDRFDMQLVTADAIDGEGFSYIGPTATGLSGLEHSYQAFGNDGVSYNTRINNTFSGRSQSAAVLNALHDFSDHLPVVADYQLPAVLGVEVDPIPLTLTLGEEFSLDVAISNAADVVAAAGADELDYTLGVLGDLIADASSGTLQALASDAIHSILLDTSTVGVRSGTLTVSTASEAAANALFELPISYEVISTALLAGDYNDDGLVDAADYTLWRDGGSLANETVTLGETTAEDYAVWRDGFGDANSSAAIPEPASLLLVGLASIGLACNRR